MVRKVGIAVLLAVVSLRAHAQSADLSVTLTGPATVFADYDTATPTVSFSITNAGPTTVPDLTVDFSPGLGVNLLPFFTCETVTNHVRCTTSSFPPTTVQGTGAMHLQQPADGTVATMSATVSSATIPDPNRANNTSSVSETVAWKSFITLGFSLPATVPQGGGFGDTISYSNQGPSNATDVKITLSLPQHVFFREAWWDSPFACVTPPVGSPGDIICTAKKVGETDLGSIGFDIGFDPATPVGTTLVFSATLTSSDAVQSPQLQQASVTVIPPAVFMTTLVSPASVEPGDTFANDVTLTNQGPNPAVNTVVTFSLSGARSIASASGPAGWSCSVPIPTRAVCSISSFAPGTATFSFPISLSPAELPGKLTETVTASSPSELNGLHDYATATTWISPEKLPDFSLTVDAPPIVHPGGTATYTIKVTNTSVNTAYNPVLQFITTPLSPIRWSCLNSPVAGVCGLGTVAGGSSRTVIADVPVVADSTSRMTAFAEIVGGPYLHNPQVSVTSIVQPTPADLSLALTATPSALTDGDTVTFTILVTNIGEVSAPNVTIDEPLPPSLAFVSSTGHCTGDSDVQCSLGHLAPGAWSTTTITARAIEPGATSVTATAKMDASDPDESNNSATVPITISAPVVRRRAAHH